MMNKNTPISIFNSTISSLKKLIDGDVAGSPTKIDEHLFSALSDEGLRLLHACKELDKDDHFIEFLNLKLLPKSHNTLYRTQNIFLSELIELENNNPKKNRISDFVLAFYYDVLKNNRFAYKESIPNYEAFIGSEEFAEVIKNIVSKNKLPKKNPQQGNIIISALKETNHHKYNDFVNFFSNFQKLSGNSLSDFTVDQNFEKVENNNISYPPKDDTLEKSLEELNNLVGLESVKNDIKELINLLKIQKQRTKEGLKNIDLSLHTVFLGPPGTGKTTVARLLGRIFKHLGYLPIGQLYESDRADLVAGFVGQTAIKTEKVLDESLGGVLFIDEAYSLTQNAFGSDYGSEAINTIIKKMEDNRSNLAVVVAGYNEPMEYFIESNPGLRSRFNRYFHFDHFSKEQLLQIFENFCANSDFNISAEAKDKLLDTFSLMDAHKTESFGNARVVRNIFEKTVQRQANRLVNTVGFTDQQLKEIIEDDIPEPLDSVDSIKSKSVS